MLLFSVFRSFISNASRESSCCCHLMNFLMSFSSRHFSWNQKCPTQPMASFFFSRPHTERSNFHKISIGLPILLKSKLGCFQRVPPLGNIVFEAFSVTICGNFSFWGIQKSIAFARSTYDRQNYDNQVFRPSE